MTNLYEEYIKLKNSKDVKFSKDPNLPIISIKYTQSTMNWENQLVSMARGLVIDTKGNIIAKPYNKFFNYKQLDYLKTENRKNLDEKFTQKLNQIDIPSNDFIKLHSDWPDNIAPVAVSDKLDGSLMIVTTYNNQLMAFSSGMTSGTYPTLFTNTLNEKLSKEQITKLTNYLQDKTLLFEYINSKIDPHVISYDYVGFKLHGMVDNKTFTEVTDKENLQKIADKFGLELVDFHDELNTKQKVLDYIDNTPDIEGLVVTLENGIHLKLKTSEYRDKFLKMSTIYSNVVTKNIKLTILDYILDDTLDDVLPYVSQPVMDEVNRIIQITNDFDNNLISFANSVDKLTETVHSRSDFFVQLLLLIKNSPYKDMRSLPRIVMNELSKGYATNNLIIAMMNNKQKLISDLLKFEK